MTGLQNMINTAVNYISEHGLRFNPVKTNCLIKGKHSFNNDPKWYINGTGLKNRTTYKLLSAVISINSGKEHVSSRLNSCRKAFYSLQGAGLSFIVWILILLCIYGQVHASLCCYMAVNPCTYQNKILRN